MSDLIPLCASKRSTQVKSLVAGTTAAAKCTNSPIHWPRHSVSLCVHSLTELPAGSCAKPRIRLPAIAANFIGLFPNCCTAGEGSTPSLGTSRVVNKACKSERDRRERSRCHTRADMAYFVIEIPSMVQHEEHAVTTVRHALVSASSSAGMCSCSPSTTR